MFCTTSETEGEVGPVKLFQSPSYSLLTVPRRLFCCGFLLPVFGVGGGGGASICFTAPTSPSVSEVVQNI